ncbi:hypothetical protein HaLaN_28805 [Haematococcus lacustris]|uniref:Uncharacterized protein n=1 Tax=Haematococcus lacustris TaxID=44745 RepID=A0A6A0AD66_HAELA|nr:hypothetical protein HaLaN_05982 [Haematococcus lacustris]GFH30034.1 hypothetical protein HaLaN_28805 [Haematococcus lacustris]
MAWEVVDCTLPKSKRWQEVARGVRDKID